MFADQPDKSTLKQGDIIRDLMFPLARLDTARVVGRFRGVVSGRLDIEAVFEGQPTRPHHVVQVQGVIVSCAVLSQCCDVVPSQNPPPHSFVVCKLVLVPPSIKKHPAWYTTLQGNLDPYGERKAYIKNFWFGQVGELVGEYMADFGQVMTVSWADYDSSLKNKVAELDDLHRAMFRIKIGAHFGRVTDEDKLAGYEDPYSRSDAQAIPHVTYWERVKTAVGILWGN